VTATVTASASGKSASTTVTFYPPPVPVVTSVIVSANPTSVVEDGQHSTTITIRVLDQNQSPMIGVTVNIATTAGTLSSSVIVTDNQGTASVILTPNQQTTSPVTVTVTASSNGKSGTTTVTFYPPSQPSGDSYEPDNSFTQYSSMSVSTTLQSQMRSIRPANDQDYIRFMASAGTYTFYTLSQIDTYGHLYDSNQRQLAYNDDGGGGLQFRIVYNITVNGYYFLRVRGYSSSVQGSYTLYFSYVPSAAPPPPIPGDTYEPDGSFVQYSFVTPTTSLQSQLRSIEPVGDKDIIRFPAESGLKYVF
jgi:hypothetical protein